MKIHALVAVSCAAALGLSGCTTNQLGVAPNIHFTPSQGQLFAAVGTANINGQAGLNVVSTFRAPNGLTGVPVSTATVAGPAGFAGPGGSADPGHGLTTIPMGSALNNFGLQIGLSTNLAGIDMYGVGPPSNSQQNSAPNLYPTQPQFGDVNGGGAFAACGGEIPFYGGPPAYPSAGQNLGYPEGFYLVASGAPPTGAYTVTLSYSQNGTTTNVPVAANLASAVPLPVIAAPTYVSDGAGGGSGTVNVPGGVTEVLVDVIDAGSGAGPACSPGVAYATVLVKGSGAQNYVVPAGSVTVGDHIVVHAVGFDYNAFELGPPTDMNQNPGLPAQADVTISAETLVTE